LTRSRESGHYGALPEATMSSRFAHVSDPGASPIVVESLTTTLARPEELPDVPSFRIAAYNVWNLFGDEPDVHSPRPNPPASVEQLKALAKMILETDAAAIAFEEVQNRAILSKVFKKYVNPKLDDGMKFTAFVCVPSHDPRGINVALATRLAVRGTISFQDREFGDLDDSPKKFSRDLLGVRLNATPKYEFLFFVAHLKSKMGGDTSTFKRLLEAKEAREILEEPAFGRGPSFITGDLVLAGDMNDDPGTEVIDTLRGSGPTAMRDVLADLDDSNTYPTHTRYRKTRLDYIFASPTIQIGDPKIHKTDIAADASDHYPVSAEITVPV
jgi:endonuclease/exonuclease/phosphatase family metal-dependent hydrolase